MKWIIPIIALVLFSGCLDFIQDESGSVSLVGKNGNPSQERFNNVQSLVPGLAANIFTDAGVPIDVKNGRNKGHGTYIASSKGKKVSNSQLIFKTAEFIKHTGAVIGQGYIDHYDDSGTFTVRLYFDFDYNSEWFVVNVDKYSENVIGGVTGQFTKTCTGLSSGEACTFDSLNVTQVTVNITNTPRQYIEAIANGSMVSTETNIPLQLFANISGIDNDTVHWIYVNGTHVAMEKEWTWVSGNISLFYPANTTAGADFTVRDEFNTIDGTEPSNDSTYGGEAVWGGYEFVCLMNEDPTTGCTDRTGNAHNATGTGFVSGDLQDSTYGKMINFDGTDAFFDIGRMQVLEGTAEDWTVITYAQFDVDGGSRVLWSYDINVNENSLNIGDYWTHWTTALQGGTGTTQSELGFDNISDNTMHYMTFGRSSTNFIATEDDTEEYNSTHTGADATGGWYHFAIGDNLNVAHLDGKVRFFAVHPDNLSSNYKLTQYKNQKNPTATSENAFYNSISAITNISSNITAGIDTSSNYNITDGEYSHIMSSVQEIDNVTVNWDGYGTATVQVIVYTTDDPLQTTKTYANGYKNGTMYINHDANITDVLIIANLDNSSVEYSGTIVDLSNDQNVTDIRYNSSNVIWNSTQVNNSVTHWYNYSLPVNNASINAQANQTCEWNLTCTITTSASDVDGASQIKYNTTINGTTVTGANPEFTDTSKLTLGTQDIFSNVTDFNGTIGDAPYSWSNLSKVLTVSDTIAPYPVTNLANTTGNFWVNWTWTNPTESDWNSTLVYINGAHQTNTTNEYYNWTSAAGLTVNVELKSQDIRGNVNATTVTDSVTMNTTAQANQIIVGW